MDNEDGLDVFRVKLAQLAKAHRLSSHPHILPSSRVSTRGRLRTRRSLAPTLSQLSRTGDSGERGPLAVSKRDSIGGVELGRVQTLFSRRTQSLVCRVERSSNRDSTALARGMVMVTSFDRWRGYVSGHQSKSHRVRPGGSAIQESGAALILVTLRHF